MAYRIDAELCSACGSCEDVCPNQAITHKGKLFSINPKKCKECEGDYDTPQCADVCPNGACMPAAA
ncbi:4Fe-4S binding protein [Azospirillum sp. ST 5-10]|uniref:4Fe-4S binding protein n=1 Tax=unclassified Azospirillum TaxID=2630922 RepID=UPI003F4A3B91